MLSPGDEVIVPAHTWISTSEMVVRIGATPIFADVDANTCCLDVNDVAQKISNRTKAVIVVHLYGSPANLDALSAVCDQNTIELIEDCAQAHGTLYHGQKGRNIHLANERKLKSYRLKWYF
ncbi:MAG TPA: hypothetical protein ENH91_14685 [Leeuwenhoekiella sp.]|nr:hypothetical protein [Leeuwenhoekiella sp.]